MAKTKVLFNQVVEFYVLVLSTHPELLNTTEKPGLVSGLYSQSSNIEDLARSDTKGIGSPKLVLPYFNRLENGQLSFIDWLVESTTQILSLSTTVGNLL